MKHDVSKCFIWLYIALCDSYIRPQTQVWDHGYVNILHFCNQMITNFVLYYYPFTLLYNIVIVNDEKVTLSLV